MIHGYIHDYEWEGLEAGRAKMIRHLGNIDQPQKEYSVSERDILIAAIRCSERARKVQNLVYEMDMALLKKAA